MEITNHNNKLEPDYGIHIYTIDIIPKELVIGREYLVCTAIGENELCRTYVLKEIKEFTGTVVIGNSIASGTVLIHRLRATLLDARENALNRKNNITIPK